MASEDEVGVPLRGALVRWPGVPGSQDATHLQATVRSLDVRESGRQEPEAPGGVLAAADELAHPRPLWSGQWTPGPVEGSYTVEEVVYVNGDGPRSTEDSPADPGAQLLWDEVTVPDQGEHADGVAGRRATGPHPA